MFHVIVLVSWIMPLGNIKKINKFNEFVQDSGANCQENNINIQHNNIGTHCEFWSHQIIVYWWIKFI